MIPYIKQKQDMLALMFILRINWIVKGSCYILKHSQGLVNRAVRCFQMIQTSLQSEVSLNGTCSLLYEGLSNNDSMLLLILHPAACVLDHVLQSNKPSSTILIHHPLRLSQAKYSIHTVMLLFAIPISAVNTEASSSPGRSARSRGASNRWSIICQDRGFVK